MMDNYRNRRAEAYLSVLKRSPFLEGPVRSWPAENPGADAVQTANGLVFTPVMHAYVIWILREAVRLGIRRLYFLARDGYLVYQTACLLCSRLGLDVECRYIYCSRFSLRQPMYHRHMEEALDYICRGGLSLTAEKLLIRSGFSEADIREIYPRIGLDGPPDQPIAYAQLGAIRRKLESCPAYMDRVRRNSREAVPALEGYFRQEGLLDTCPAALVDLGWTGSMQKSIRQIRELLGCTAPLHGFYFGMYYLPPDCDGTKYHCFYFSPRRHLLRKVFFNNNLLEVVYSAPHGTTCGYRREGEGYVPVLSQPQPRICALILQLSEEMEAYSRRLLKDLTAQQFFRLDTNELARTSAGLLRKLMSAPTVREADGYGALPFSDDMLDDRPGELAAVMTRRELKDNHLLNRILVMLGIRHCAIRDSAWFEGSVVRSVRRTFLHRANFSVFRLLVYLRQMLRK